MSFTAGDANTIAAAWLNNPSKSIYTDAKLLICLAQAQRDLQDALLENNIGFMRKKSSVINIAIAATTVTLPNDFYEPITLFERPDGGSDEDWVEVEYYEFLPEDASDVGITGWSYNAGVIEITAPTTARDVKLYYRATFTFVSTTATVIPEDEYKSYLCFRSAAIAAATIGENESRAKALEEQAGLALGTLLRLGVKQNQEEPARRLPYRGQHALKRVL